MGASDWQYFVPYEVDVNAALQKLRQQVFDRGDYYKVEYGEWRDMTDEEAEEAFYDPSDSELSKIIIDDWRAVKELAEPTTPDTLVDWNRESGTHTIIDINRGVSEQPDYGTVSPLSAEQMLAYFGTATPDHERVRNWLETTELSLIRRRSMGIYITIFENDKPVEYCFAGYSGD